MGCRKLCLRPGCRVTRVCVVLRDCRVTHCGRRCSCRFCCSAVVEILTRYRRITPGFRHASWLPHTSRFFFHPELSKAKKTRCLVAHQVSSWRGWHPRTEPLSAHGSGPKRSDLVSNPPICDALATYFGMSWPKNHSEIGTCGCDRAETGSRCVPCVSLTTIMQTRGRMLRWPAPVVMLILLLVPQHDGGG